MAKKMCPVCAKKGISRRGMGTCGSRHCFKVMQGWAIHGREADDPPKDARDPAVNKKIKTPSGQIHTVARSVTRRGVDCYVLKDGTTLPISRCGDA